MCILTLKTETVSSTWQNYLHDRLAPRNILEEEKVCAS